MRVPIEGGEYTIRQDRAGTLVVDRYNSQWKNDPQMGGMLISIAYELVCLRRIAKAAIDLLQNKSNNRYDDILKLARSVQDTHELTDINENLDDPGEV